MLANWVKFGSNFFCYLKALSSLRHLIFPKEARSITTSMKRGEVLRLCRVCVSIKEPLGELTKEKEGCESGNIIKYFLCRFKMNLGI